jgi:beta-glucanase (GH16 family)
VVSAKKLVPLAVLVAAPACLVAASCVATVDDFVTADETTKQPVMTPATGSLPQSATPARASGPLASTTTTKPNEAAERPQSNQRVGYYQDFSQGIGPEWDRYDSIGHAGWGLRRPSAITVEDDPTALGGKVMVITARMGTEGDETGLLVSGGTKLRLPQTYGRYTFRVRIESDPSEVTSGVVLLWPASNEWPADGELDMVETWANRVTRSPVETNVHWADPAAVEPIERSDDRVFHHVSEGISATDWHVYQFEWRPDRLTLSIDGAEPALITDDPVMIPRKPMEMTVQLDGFDAPYAPDQQPVVATPVRMYVDWLLVEP